MIKPQIKAMYVAVRDMRRAVKFYEDVFEVKASSTEERMSSFDFENLSFLLFNPEADGADISIGNNIVPNIEVGDIDKMLEFVESKECEIVMPVEKIGKYLIFQVKDTEGNIIEFYQSEN